MNDQKNTSIKLTASIILFSIFIVASSFLNTTDRAYSQTKRIIQLSTLMPTYASTDVPTASSSETAIPSVEVIELEPPASFTLLQPTIIPPEFGRPTIEYTDISAGLYYQIEGRASLVILQYFLPLPDFMVEYFEDYAQAQTIIPVHVEEHAAQYGESANGRYLWYNDEQRMIEIVFSSSPESFELLTQYDLIEIAGSMK